MKSTEPAGVTGRTGSSTRLSVALVGSDLRAASVLRLLSEVDVIDIAGVCCADSRSPVARVVESMGVFLVRDCAGLNDIVGLDLVINLSGSPDLHEFRQGDTRVETLGAAGAELIWDLLVAKKRGEEQERLFVELQVAYEQIRGHERNLQSNGVALEHANAELECRLAEIFFTHEFFKALTSYRSTDDVCSLIVDGANGILGAEISAVYLLDKTDWTLRLRATQGRPDDMFQSIVTVEETILGTACRDGLAFESDVESGARSARWFRLAGEVGSQAAVALRTGDDTIGVLVIASPISRKMTSAELERLQVIAHQSSLSLQNALLHGELERLSVTDRLTELYNHGYFQQRLESELGRAARFGHALSLIMLDIDDFKEFNDTFGHPRGDALLKAVSAIIRANLREIDVAARYGGEEFAVVLPETDTAGAVAVAERIRRSVAEFQLPGALGLLPAGRSVSVGVASFPVHASGPGRLVEAADQAMYASKREGKNRVKSAG